MSIQRSFTCVACEYRRLPFDPQESAGTCPSCQQVYLKQSERVSKRELRILQSVERETALIAKRAKEAAEEVSDGPQVQGLAFPIQKPDGFEMPNLQKAAGDLVELVESAAVSDPKIRAEIEGEDEPPKKFRIWPFG